MTLVTLARLEVDLPSNLKGRKNPKVRGQARDLVPEGSIRNTVPMLRGTKASSFK